MIQKWKLNLDAAEYENKIDSDVYKPSAKKEIDCHDSDSYWPTSIKDTIQWFTFITIIEHTANILDPNKWLIPSLLKVFSMFQLSLFYDKHNQEENVVDAIAIRCINCNKYTGLMIKNTTI